MIESLKPLTSDRRIRIPLTFLASAGAALASLWTLAEVLGLGGSLELFLYLILASVILSSNLVWLVEYVTLHRQQDQSANLMAQIARVGLTRSEIDYERYISSCTREIRLWGLSLHSFSTTRMIELLVEQFRKEDSLNIRILLLDPDSQFARYRGRQKAYEGKRPEYLKETIQQSISQFRWMGNLLQQEFRSAIWRTRCDVKLYDGYTSMGMVVFDDDAIVSHYFHRLSGSVAPYVVFHRTGNEQHVYQLLMLEFDEVWSRAQSVFGTAETAQ